MAIMAFSFNALAGKPVSDEKIVTTKWSLLFGPVTYADHYISNQEYSGGLLTGFSVDFGSFYKKSENLSWALDLTYAGVGQDGYAAPKNPAKSSTLGIRDIDVEYGTSYNWNPIKNLYLRAGGAFSLNAGVINAPKSINNVMQFIFQPQFKATAGIRYGWNIRKMKLNLYADLGIPFMGLMMVGSNYEGTKDVIVNLTPTGMLKTSINHFKFSSFHNLQGYNLDIGLDLEFDKLSFILSVDTNDRWWNAYGSQCYKKYALINIGFAVDLVSRPRSVTNNRYF